MRMPDGAIIIGAIATCVLFGADAYRKWRDKRRRHLAFIASPAAGTSVAEGTAVHVTGKVRITDETLTAPLSGRKCVAYIARMYIRDNLLGNKGTEWSSGEVVPFVIVEADGRRVAIDSAHARLDFPPLPLPAGSGQRCDDFAKLHNLSAGARKRVFFEEIVVTEDMRVSIAGTLVKDAPGAPSTDERAYREDQAPALRLGGNAARPILIAVPVDPAVQRG